MSSIALENTWSIKGLTPLERLVLQVLADHCNPTDGRCFPSVSTIAALVESPRQSCSRALKSLQSKRVIQIHEAHRKNGSQTVNNYVLLFPWRREEHKKTDRTPETTGCTPETTGCTPCNEMLHPLQRDVAPRVKHEVAPITKEELKRRNVSVSEKVFEIKRSKDGNQYAAYKGRPIFTMDADDIMKVCDAEKISSRGKTIDELKGAVSARAWAAI